MTEAPVLVGVDGSEESKRALRWAADYARISHTPLHAIIAWDTPTSYGMPAIYDDVELETQARAAVTETVTTTLDDARTVTLRAERGHAAAVLVAASTTARLLVVGSRGHGGFAAALLGSVSNQCINHAHCPVVVVRGDTVD